MIAAVAGIDALVFDIHAVGAGHADAVFITLQDVCDQTDGCGFAIGASHRDNRNTTIVAFLEHGGDDCFADRTAFAERWLDVHAQAWCRIDFNHAAALFFQGLDDAFAYQVDATDIETDHLCSFYRACCEVRMDIVGNVGCGATGTEVGVVAQDNLHAFRRYAFQCVIDFGQGCQGQVIDLDLGQRAGMAITAQWIEVNLVDQLT